MKVRSAATALLLAGGLFWAPPPTEAPAPVPAARPIDRVPLQPSAAPAVPGSGARQVPLARAPKAAVWPVAGSSTVDIPAGAAARPAAVRVGRQPIWVSTVDGSAVTVGVQVLDRVAGRDLAIRLTAAGSGSEAGSGSGSGKMLRLRVDTAGFADAYGGNWADRLSFTVTGKDGLAQRVASSRQGSTVEAQVPVDGSVVALAADPGSPTGSGDYGATSLSSSATWSAGGNSGGFTWSYPVRVPPSLGGPAPNVSLAYSSQSVDGRTATSNAQPSWVGEGFDWNPGFIERRYVGCSDDQAGADHNDTTKTGDLCWRNSNAVLSLNGHGGELIYNASEGLWHATNDDGSKIQHLTGASNGDGGSSVDGKGEYWVVTTTDGTRYYFGLNRLQGWTSGKDVTNSTLTVPVYGNDPGEPCYVSGSFSTSSCTQAYRWMLDYVVDTHGNTMSLWWAKDTNQYGRNMSETSLATYDRDAVLVHIDYGTHQRTLVGGVKTDTEYASAVIPMRVQFNTGDRCVSSCGTQTSPTTANWPDTPWDLKCTAAPCDDHSPAFYSSRRLASVTTKVWDPGLVGLRDVETWTLSHTFPDPSDGTKAGLWLNTISHKGLVGGSVSVPDISFQPIMLDNRVDTTLINGLRPFRHPRMNLITSETGGTINVNYLAGDCTATSKPTPETNTKRCYPVRWAPEDLGGTPGQEIVDWFHKYVVDTVIETDATGPASDSASSTTTRYVYVGSPAWHYSDDDGLTKPKYLTWNQWRGYDTVRTLLGTGADQTRSETRYFRGMNGDKLDKTSDSTKSVTLIDSKSLLGTAVADENEFAGQVLETVAYTGPSGTPLSGTVSRPWRSDPRASRTIDKRTVYARFVNVADAWAWSLLDGGRPNRVVHSHADFDSLGMTTAASGDGDTSVTGDERCTLTDYARNLTANITALPSRVRSYAITCAKALTAGHVFTPDEIISEGRTSYDGQAYGAAPTFGDATQTEALKDWVNNTFVGVVDSRSAYDDYGRVTDDWDIDGKRTTIQYTPAADAPVTAVTKLVPTPAGQTQWSTTDTIEPASGTTTASVDVNGRRTESSFDPLGRKTAMWLPGRADTLTPNYAFAYTISRTKPSVVETKTLGPNGVQTSTFQFYDALLRPRQMQAQLPSGNAGRLVTDQFYDSAGRQWRAYGPYVPTDTADPSATLSPLPADNFDHIKQWSKVLFDGAGRKAADVQFSQTVEQSRTTTTYPSADRTDTLPPNGATPTSTVTDASGNLIESRSHHDRTISTDPSTYDSTRYAYNQKGMLTTVTDPAGTVWSYQYDILGRQTGTTDPDRGSATLAYDDAGRVTTATDARGVKLLYHYDSLGRKDGLYRTDMTAANQLAGWGYDGLTTAKGIQTSSVSYVGGANGDAYTSSVTGLNAAGLPSQTRITIPTAETGLAATYQYDLTYKVNGAVATSRSAGIGGAAGLGFETLTYTYTDLGLPLSLSTSATGWLVTATTYDDLGGLSTITLRDSLTSPSVMLNRDYDPATRRLNHTWVTRSTSPTAVSDVHLDYDQAGTVLDTKESSTVAGAETQCFTHDYLQRLTQAWTPASGDCSAAPAVSALGGPAPYWTQWTFDVAGNRLQQKENQTPSGLRTTTYHYPAATATRPHALSDTSTVDNAGTRNASYTYDDAGNTATRPAASGAQSLTWDERGQLTTDKDAGGRTDYVYDADGNRLIREDTTGRTLYLPGQELRVSKDGGTVLSATRYYQWAGQTIATRSATGGLTWMVADQHNTTNLTINAGSQAVAVRRQDPYGNPRGSTSGAWPSTLDKGFVGGTQDGTGLTHLGAREYDPGTGRFATPDAVVRIQEPGGAYSYADDSPVMGSDPTGLMPFEEDNDGTVNTGQLPGCGSNFCLVDPLIPRRDRPKRIWEPRWPEQLPVKRPTIVQCHNYSPSTASSPAACESGDTYDRPTCGDWSFMGPCPVPDPKCGDKNFVGPCPSTGLKCGDKNFVGPCSPKPSQQEDLGEHIRKLSGLQKFTLGVTTFVIHAAIQTACMALPPIEALTPVVAGVVCGGIAGAIADGIRYLLTMIMTGEKFDGHKFLSEVFWGAVKGAAVGGLGKAFSEQFVRILGDDFPVGRIFIDRRVDAAENLFDGVTTVGETMAAGDDKEKG
jgi:RHS repeat-associated protein